MPLSELSLSELHLIATTDTLPLCRPAGWAAAWYRLVGCAIVLH